MRRKFDSDIISLMHFNYPYPYPSDAGDGMRDEIGVLSWEKVGNATFVGTEQPVAAVVAETPKFGWRCLQATAVTDYLSASETTGKLSINKAGTWEMEAFVRRTGSTAGNAITLLKEGVEVFSVSLASAVITVLGDGVSITTSSAPASSTWAHLCVRISGGECHVYIDGVDVGNATITAGIIEADEIRLGGFPGQMDEFRLRTKAGADLPIVPDHPYQGVIPLKTLGGWGNGSQGDVSISEANVDINTTAIVQSGSDQMLTIGAQSTGQYGVFVPGDKVMIHVSLGKAAEKIAELGKFSVRNVANFAGDILTLDSPIDEFSVNPDDYYIQVIKIPQFKTLTVSEGASIVPKAWNTTTGGGIAALVSKGDCVISGNITSIGKGPVRTDEQSFCHDLMQERFIHTGNVFLLCGGTLTATGYIGGTGGSAGRGGKGGNGHYCSVGGIGIVGYGGGGGGGWKSGGNGGTEATNMQGSNGSNVGGGGGGTANGKGGHGASGVDGTEATKVCGGNGGYGVFYGDSVYHYAGGGGGGFPGFPGYSNTPCGASCLIVCHTLNMVGISASGADGSNGGSHTHFQGYGGGGTGFCYIACKEVI